MSKPRVIVITGATSAGKSRAIYNLPENAPIEVINADARQVYDKMSIGTAMPSPEERQRFPHHLFGFLDPNETYSAGKYLKDTKKIIESVLERGNMPIVVGGSFFYIKALWDGLAEIPDVDPKVTQYTEALSPQEVQENLDKHDPLWVKRIHRNDLYRQKRALMVVLSTQKTMEMFKPRGGTWHHYDYDAYWLDYPREMLYERINQKTASMFREGLFEEFQKLIGMGYDKSSPGLKSIGYAEFFEFLEGLERQTSPSPNFLREIQEKISQNTRNFAKRQITWFRSEKRLKRIDQSCNVFQLSELLEYPKG